jgi:hypothetical protein
MELITFNKLYAFIYTKHEKLIIYIYIYTSLQVHTIK